MKVKEKYEKEVVNKLGSAFAIKNMFAIPKIEKVVINVGYGKVATDEKSKEVVFANLSKITGQKPASKAAKKAIASFKIRKGQPIGAQVTLRGAKMFDFLDKLTAIVLPRVRDFRGVTETSFDKDGNYTLGFRELNVFPEIDYTKSEKQTGLEITIVTSAKNPEQGKVLLEGIGIPFRKVNN